MDWFFKLAPKDPKKKLSFEYSLSWVMFSAVLYMAGLYFYRAIRFHDYLLIGWGLVMIAFSYFSYSNVVMMRNTMKMFNQNKETKIESVEEMAKEFKG